MENLKLKSPSMNSEEELLASASEISAGGVVFVGERIVVLQSSEGEWVLPKGHVESGETPEAAALREVREETGLRARILARLGVTAYRTVISRKDGSNEHVKVVHWFLMTAGGTPEPESSFPQLVFLPADQALAQLTFANQKEMVRRALTLQLGAVTPGSDR